MIAGLMASAITFRKDTLEKVAFIALNVMDMALTVFAVSNGAHELNPLVRSMVNSPSLLLLVKFFVPVVFAWLIPGKLLIPAIVLLSFVVGWDLRELILLA